jgi:Domain of unknown function (DUF4296)
VKGSIKISTSIFAVIFGFMAVVSCQKPEEKKPDYVLSHEEMVKALAEVYINEQKISRLSVNSDSASLIFGSMERKIFENLNIPDSVFRASVDYYMDHPIEMEKIYAVLIDSLQLREQRVPRETVQ